MNRTISIKLALPLLLGGLLASGCQSLHGSSSMTKKDSRGSAVEAKSPRGTATPKPASSPRRSSALVPTASMSFPTGDADTSALMVQKLAPAQVIVGQDFEYQVLVKNLTDMPLDNVRLHESVDGNFMIKGSQPKAVESGASRVWNLGTIAPRQTETVSITGNAKSAKAITTCASVSYDSALCSSIEVVQPALKLVAKGPAEALQCDEITYEYVVSNTGSGSADDVVVSGQLPAGLVGTDNRSSFRREIGTLGAGDAKRFTVKTKATKGGSFKHAASASASGGLEAKAGELTTTVRKPELEITKTGTERSFAGRPLKYEITVTNVGDAVAKDVTLEDSIPSGASFASATERGRAASGKTRWMLGELRPQESRKIEVRYTADQVGSMTSTAMASAYCATTVSAKVQSNVTGIPAILMEVVDLEDPIEVGENLTYLITITNQGTAPATNVKIAVTIPESAEYVSATGTTNPMSAPSAGKFTLAPVRSIAPKGKATWRVVLKGRSAADARFKVSMTSDQLTSPVEETEATNFYE